MRCRELFIENALVVSAAQKEESVETPEVAVDLFVANDALDAIDRRTVALDDLSRAFSAMNVLENVDAIVHRVRKVRRRSSRLAAANRAVVDDDHLLSRFGEQIRRRQSRDSGTDDAHITARRGAE
jgi:hypothetical protein